MVLPVQNPSETRRRIARARANKSSEFERELNSLGVERKVCIQSGGAVLAACKVNSQRPIVVPGRESDLVTVYPVAIFELEGSHKKASCYGRVSMNRLLRPWKRL